MISSVRGELGVGVKSHLIFYALHKKWFFVVSMLRATALRSETGSRLARASCTQMGYRY